MISFLLVMQLQGLIPGLEDFTVSCDLYVDLRGYKTYRKCHILWEKCHRVAEHQAHFTGPLRSHAANSFCSCDECFGCACQRVWSTRRQFKVSGQIVLKPYLQIRASLTRLQKLHRSLHSPILLIPTYLEDPANVRSLSHTAGPP